MTDKPTNDPKVLVEFSPEEVKWLADLLHTEWGRTLAAKAIASSPTAIASIEKHQEMERNIRNRILDNASKQGFGEL